MAIKLFQVVNEYRYFRETHFKAFPTNEPHNIISPINRKL